LLEAVTGSAQRFVYVSSVGVFGRPGATDRRVLSCLCIQRKLDYHNTKAEGERTTLGFREQIEVVITRPTIAYGPGDADGMVTQLFKMVARGRFVRIGRGDNTFT